MTVYIYIYIYNFGNIKKRCFQLNNTSITTNVKYILHNSTTSARMLGNDVREHGPQAPRHLALPAIDFSEGA